MTSHSSKTSLGWGIVTIFLVIALSSLAAGQRRMNEGLPFRWSVFDYPDPHSQNQDQQTRCGRLNVSSVCDPNRLISRTEADAIDNLINEVYSTTVCPCSGCTANNRGYIIRVAIMPQFERPFNDNDTSTLGTLRNAQMFAYLLSERWRMQGTCNETVLIVYARDDNMLYTLTRRTSMVRLTDDRITEILMQVRHYFDDNNTVAEGLLEMIRQYQYVFQEGSDRGRRSINR